jgi:hypothetical protein
MGLEVIGAGLGRTGTLSLKTALEELGIGNCYHMTEILDDPPRAQAWIDAAADRPVDWEQVFEGYRATVDVPGAAYWAELKQRFPEAKVVLTVRDPEDWYTSSRETIYELVKGLPSWLPWFSPRARVLREMADRIVWDGLFEDRFEDREYAIERFEAHNEAVRRAVPRGELLVFDVAEGWEPLCRFLGVPVPEGKPFPRMNEAARIKQKVREIRRLKVAVHALTAGVLAGALAYPLV